MSQPCETINRVGGGLRQEHHCQDLRYSNTCHTGKHSGPYELVTNADQASPRDPKAFRCDGGGYRGDNGNYRAKTPTSRSSIVRLC
jgi:hypothetical protein